MKKKGILDIIHDYPIILFVAGLFCILLGISVKGTGTAHLETFLYYASVFLKELGFALIIAFVISIGIEKYARERQQEAVDHHIQRIKRSIFEGVYGTRQEPELVKLLEDVVFENAFFRTGYEVHIDMEHIETDMQRQSNDTLVKLKIDCRFYVHNRTEEERDFVFKVKLEKPYDPTLRGVVSMTALKLGDYHLNDKNIREADDCLEDNEDFKMYSWKRRTLPNEALYVQAKYVIVKYARDAMPWYVFGPCDGFRLLVHHPKNIVVYGLHAHPCDDGVRKEGGGLEDSVFELQIDKPLLPNHGAFIWWSLIPQVPQLAAQPASAARGEGATD